MVVSVIFGVSAYVFAASVKNAEPYRLGPESVVSMPDKAEVPIREEIVEKTQESLQESIQKTENKTIGISLSSDTLHQGDTALITFENGEQVTETSFRGRPLNLFNFAGKKHALLALAATEKTGNFELVTKFTGGEIKTPITVDARDYPLIELGIPESLDMTEKDVVANLTSQKKNINEISKNSAPMPLFEHDFTLPLSGEYILASIYGEVRKTGAETIRHLGIDLAGDRGESVHAINDGVVLDAYTDPVYGNSVILDHGASIISLYLHLDNITIKKGKTVTRGEEIGKLGSTGYSTSPHLHLSVKVNGTSVDPLNFISLWKN